MSALDEIRGRLETANAEMDRLTAGNPGTNWRWSIPADPERDSDLILAAALADNARLLAAVEGALGLHESAEILSLTHDGHLDYDGDVLRVYCTACTSDDVKQLIGDCEWTEDDEVVGWPCPTVEAITAALEVS